MAILGQNYVDLSPLFNLNPTRNYLLASLGLFDGVGVSSHKVAVSRLVEDNRSLYNEPTARFSSEHNVTARQNGKEYLIELPYFLREDQITPADIQGSVSLALTHKKPSPIYSLITRTSTAWRLCELGRAILHVLCSPAR
jgi:hypothetical protein